MRKTRSFWKLWLNDPQRGIGIVSALVGIAILGILALTLSKTLSTGFQGAKSIELRQDLEVLRMTVRTQLDCRKTFGITPSTTLPLSCSSFTGNIPLRRANNSVINPMKKIGEWTVQSSCEANELIVKATKAGNDPLTGKPWSSHPAATDLFSGVSDFCRSYLDTSAKLECIEVRKEIPNNFNLNTFSMTKVNCPGGRILTSVSVETGCSGRNWMSRPVTPAAGQEPSQGFCAFVHAYSRVERYYDLVGGVPTARSARFWTADAPTLQNTCGSNDPADEVYRGYCRAVCCLPPPR